MESILIEREANVFIFLIVCLPVRVFVLSLLLAFVYADIRWCTNLFVNGIIT